MEYHTELNAVKEIYHDDYLLSISSEDHIISIKYSFLIKFFATILLIMLIYLFIKIFKHNILKSDITLYALFGIMISFFMYILIISQRIIRIDFKNQTITILYKNPVKIIFRNNQYIKFSDIKSINFQRALLFILGNRVYLITRDDRKILLTYVNGRKTYQLVSFIDNGIKGNLNI